MRKEIYLLSFKNNYNLFFVKILFYYSQEIYDK